MTSPLIFRGYINPKDSVIPQTKISIPMIKKCGSRRLWGLVNVVTKVRCKLRSMLGALQSKSIELLRQRNLG